MPLSVTGNRCAIVSVGDELLLGVIADTNAAWLAGELWRRGWRVRRMMVVGDETDDIAATVAAAAETADMVIVTGGLGPTEDDRTRSALAEVTGSPLEERPELVRRIEARFLAMGRKMAERNRVQARVPRGCEGLPNSCGTAPGILCRVGAAAVFALPGVPREMRAMFRESVLPRISRQTGAECVLRRELHVFGVGESSVGEILAELMRPGAEPRVGTMVHDGIITVRLLARGRDAGEVRASLDACEARARALLGEHVFGADGETLAAVVLRLLRDRRQTLAVAESCTGGMLAAALVDVPGASEVFKTGFVTYANEAKADVLDVSPALLDEHGAVSRQAAGAMARGAARAGKTDWALAVTGVAGPGGGSPDKPVGTVWLALRRPNGICYTMQRFGADRRGNRVRACNLALDMLRRALLGAPFPWDMEYDD